MISEKGRKEQIDRAKAKAKEHGGKCLTKTYTHVHQMMTWQCRHQTWDASFHRVVHQKHWCPQCFIEAKLARAHKAAEERGGKCLTTAYSGAKARMEWKCSNPNHTPWTAIYSAVVNDGHWCAKCYEEGRKKRV